MTSLQNHGLIACLVNQDGGEFCKVFGYTEHGWKRGDKEQKAIGTNIWLLELIEYCEVHSLKVLSISSPQTILGDLRGMRQSVDKGQGTMYPEVMMLKQLGHADLFVRPTGGMKAAQRAFESPYVIHV
jgi:hypothetical protein